MDMVFGLALGCVWAILDGLLMRLVVSRGAKDPAQASKIVMRGFAARYLITFAVLAVGLLVPGINAVGVVLALIAQKIILVILTLLGKGT